MQRSHGKIKGALPITVVRKMMRIARNAARVSGNLDYAKVLNMDLSVGQSLAGRRLNDIAQDILGPAPCELKAVEYHNRRSHGEEIPPHQDNFYHCVKDARGVKLLVPFVSLNSTNGGLVFARTEWEYPTQPHEPAYSVNFSAKIKGTDVESLQRDAVSYECEIGDITYHSLSSVHWAGANTTDMDADFVVFRFEERNSEVDREMAERYRLCFRKNMAHLKSRNT